MSIRKASHAGSWYSENGAELSKQLGSWLSKVDKNVLNTRAVIAPHAGYYYCGACGAYAYKQVKPEKIKRVFILGPSHHFSFSGCALTSTSLYETPLYNLEIDKEVNKELFSTKEFDVMDINVDEDEHSIEMHLPYVAKVMEKRRGEFKVVPILVGRTNCDTELKYGKILSRYLENEENLFVISSDFCHWGQRFRYTHYDKSQGEIYQSIESLDRMGMDLIEKLDTRGYYKYLDKYSNTICGRRPIGIFLNAVNQLPNGSVSFKFLQYAQSNQCRSHKDSSVSYAAGVLTYP